MESDSEDQESYTSSGDEVLDDELSGDESIVFEEELQDLSLLPGTDDESAVGNEDSSPSVSEEDSSSSEVSDTSETVQTKSGNHSDSVRCKKIDKLLQRKDWKDLLKRVSDVNGALFNSIQYHDINDMMPVDGKFLVDADSLLIFALSDNEWGGRQDGQMLHVIYICERILRVFTRIGGVCELVFFQNWENIWADKFITLARTVLMSHFKYNTNYAVHILPNAWDESFKAILEITKPNFLLQYLEFSVSDNVPKCCTKLAKIIGQVNMNFIIASGVDCLDMFDINLSISTINAHVIKSKRIPNNLMVDSAKLLNKVLCQNAAKAFDKIKIPMFIKDVRRDAFISSAAAVLLDKSASENLVRVFLLKCALVEVLPLKLRACPKVEVCSAEVQEFVSLILHYINRALLKILKCYGETPLVSDVCLRVADVWQENFFYKLLITLNEIVLTRPSDLGKETAAAYLSLVQCVNSLCKANLDPFPINVLKLVPKSKTVEVCEAVGKVKRRSTYNLENLNNLIPSTSQLMGEFCGESVLKNCWNPKEYAKVYSLICRNRDFKEIYHWHSKKMLLDDTKRVTTTGNLTKYELKKKQRSQANYAYFMQFYGNNLEGNKIVSETIVRDLRRSKQPQKAQKRKKQSNKATIIIEEIDRKRKAEILKDESGKLKDLESRQKADHNQGIASKIVEVKHFLKRVTSDSVRHETEMCLANLYYKLLKFNCKLDKKSQHDKVFIEFFLLLRELLLRCKERIQNYLCKSATGLNNPKKTSSKKGTKQKEAKQICKSEEQEEKIKMFQDLNKICSYFHCLNLGEIAAKCKEEIKNGEPLTDEILNIVEESVGFPDVFDTGFPWAQFQLNYLGPYLERESSGVFDEELGFAPDGWQAELITVIRKRQCAVVVAPTSSGKTYASYYCMKSVLRESVDGVVVYVSPTKALVNQVAATVYARFKDTNMVDGMCLLGVFTRDYRHNYENCQILITVPECLEILLLSPKRTRWVSKVRFIIFDEIHCLSGIAGGISWESGLLLSKCPFLALSATIEKPQVLEQWLKEASEYKKKRDVIDGLYDKSNDRNYEVKLIIYTERHNDLEKHIFANGEVSHIHPYMFLTRKIVLQHTGVPKTLSLSPRETLQLYFAMKKVNENDISYLMPEIFFSALSLNGFITKQQVRSYESELNEKLYNVARASPECFQLVITYLSDEKQIGIQGNIRGSELFDLVENLNKNEMLPAIIFSYNRNMVQGMFVDLTDYYTSKDESSEVEDEPQKIVVEHKPLRKGKEVVMFDRRKFSSLHLLRRNKSIRTMGVADNDDVKYIEHRLRRDNLNSKSPFVCGLRCGIGMHHGGLSRDKRTSVEMLFRMKLLNVLFATGTLALGIHMPCKTVVIAGETRFLNVLNYHQMSGRAGRRGFDTEGNLVFWNVSHSKISNLMTAKLPVMWGNIPMTVSVILRLLLLVSKGVYGSDQTDKERKWNVSRALTFLNCNLVYLHFPDLKQQMKHYFAFSNQLLMVQQLLDDDGKPQALAGIVTHLHYHEPGNLVFVYLLRHGIFNKICKEKNGKISKETELDLVLVLSHLFTYVPLHKHHLQQKFKNSRVILDKMPKFVIQEIEKYNKEVLLVFDNYFKCVAKECQEQNGEDNSLPLSAVSFAPRNVDSAYSNPLPSSLEKKLFGNLEERLICSSFAALSGHGDEGLYSQESLFSTIRHQVFTDMKILPHFNLNKHLNAYVWDFYNHGLKKAIITDNNLKEGSDFALLKDFSLVLRSLYTTLSEFDDCVGNKTVVEAFRVVSDKFSALFNNAYGIKQF